MKRHAPATQRNKQFLLDVLRRVLAGRRDVLEIASGTGEHAVFFAAEMPWVHWQPSDADADARASVEAHRAEAALPNLAPVRFIDVTRGDWGVVRADAIVCINMIHIAPWSAAEGLFRGAARLLPEGAPLVLYGPFRFGGQFTAPSNEAFDASLRERDPAWGVRDLDDVTALAERAGFTRSEVIVMPANNHTLVFHRAPEPQGAPA
jgi:cyclopropane fatty-acyl-phospholipid synthase-like methyltransferase